MSPELWRLRQSVIKKGHCLDNNPFDKNIRNSFYLMLKQYRKLNKMCLRKYKNDLLDKISDLQDKDPKAYWKLLDQMQDLNKTKSNPADNVGKDEWENYFSNLNQSNVSKDKENTLLHQLKTLENQQIFNELDYKISEKEVMNTAKNL